MSKKSSSRGTPRCLVLAPTRELALQVQTVMSRMAPFLKTVAIYGGDSVGRQLQELAQNVDIVVGTPGRVQDLINRGSLDLSKIEVAILDEADEMLNKGFLEAIVEIYKELPPTQQRQNLLFSATVPTEMRALMERFMNDPEFIDLVGEESAKVPDSVEIVAMPVGSRSRSAALMAVLAQYASLNAASKDVKRALVFVQTKQDCDSLPRMLGRQLRCRALHGDMVQRDRLVVLLRWTRRQSLSCFAPNLLPLFFFFVEKQPWRTSAAGDALFWLRLMWLLEGLMSQKWTWSFTTTFRIARRALCIVLEGPGAPIVRYRLYVSRKISLSCCCYDG